MTQIHSPSRTMNIPKNSSHILSHHTLPDGGRIFRIGEGLDIIALLEQVQLNENGRITDT